MFGQTSDKEVRKDIKSKAIKEARKEAKRLKKEGWQVEPGSLPLEKLIEKAWIKQVVENEDGSPKYMWSDGNGVGQTKTAASMQALEMAKLALAGQVQTRMASLITANIGNIQNSTVDATTVNEVIQSAKNIIAMNLGQVDPNFKIFRTHETYKPIEKGNVEMQVRIFYDKAQAEIQAKETIKEELKKKTNANEEELKKLMGM